ncbi:hypothetical protein MMC22_003459 [Lobaria immixta]|nr:hypothetical protein [Lobaria immixta]
MDAATRARSSLQHDSEWERLGYVDYLKFRPNNLTRDISPVFRYLDEQDSSRWTRLSREEYQTMEPVCRLASAMIESPASLAFLHALMYNPRTEIVGLSQRADYPCYEFCRSETSLIPDSQDPRLALKRLAPNIEWVLVDADEIAGCNGRTIIKWVESAIVDNGRVGFQSKIKLKKSLVEDLSRLSRQADKAIQTLSFQFFLAIIICHEVIHAINSAVDPALGMARRYDMARRAIKDRPPGLIRHYEPFFEDQPESELGHCWENEVLGGNITRTKTAEEPLLMCKWPNHRRTIASGGSRTPRRAGHKASHTFYIVPAHFIHSIQQQAFWDCLDPVDAISLRVQKSTGIRRWLPPGTWKDADWDPSLSSEGDWSTDEQDWVYRIEKPDVVKVHYSTANHAATTKWILDLPDPALDNTDKLHFGSEGEELITD